MTHQRPFVGAALGCIAFVVVVLAPPGCSLITIESEAEPLTQRELNTRILTHEFLRTFAWSLEETIDTVLERCPDRQVQLNGLRWTINAMTEARNAAFQTPPAVALVDLWALCSQMRLFTTVGEGSQAFGECQDLIVGSARALEAGVDSLARSLTTQDEYDQTKRFVKEFAGSHPLTDLSMARESVYRSWFRARGIPDSAAVKTVGTIPQELSNFSTQVAVTTQQLPRQGLWQTRALATEAGLSTEGVRSGIDSIRQDVKRIGVALAESPEVLDSALVRLHQELKLVLASLDRQRTETLQALSTERAEVTTALSSERSAIMDQLDQLARDVTTDAFKTADSLVATVVLGLVVLTVLVLGIPFVLGVIVGRTLHRRTAERGRGQNLG